VKIGNGSRVLHVSPHPDDECLGGGPSIVVLHKEGAEVANLAVGLGRPAVRRRRRTEVIRACQRLDIECIFPQTPISISDTHDPNVTEDSVTIEIARVIREREPALVISPWPHDRHPGHELVGRATKAAIAEVGTRRLWWTWGFWSDLVSPNLYLRYGDEELEAMRYALSAHEGELKRVDYVSVLAARGTVGAKLGSERVFGFGAGERETRYADLLEAWRFDARTWTRLRASQYP